MAKTNATPAERLKELDAVLDRIDKMEKRGNWTEDRKEILKGLTIDDIMAEVMRLQAEHPEEYSTPEEIRAMAERRIEEAQTATSRAELVGA
jgi:hypothetical protein